MKKSIFKFLSMLTVCALLFLSYVPASVSASAASAGGTGYAESPDTPGAALEDSTISAVIYTDDTYSELLTGSGVEITLSGKMPKGAQVRAYPAEYDPFPKFDYDIPDPYSTPDRKSGDVVFAYDITIFDGKKEFEPDGDAISVTFKSPELEKFTDDELSVIHVKDDGEEEEEVIEKSADNDELTITADAFSVFVVIRHEGTTSIDTPRVEFHFINESFTSHTNGNDAYYTASPFNFYNKAQPLEKQCTQILTDGETLEMIANPPNLRIPLGNNQYKEQYFYGWYVVDLYTGNNGEDTTVYNHNTGEWEGTIPYAWTHFNPNTNKPEKISFERPVTLNQTTGLSAGDEVQWTLDGVTDEGILDAEGVLHVYLAPIYEDYYFVNFRMGPLDDESGSSLKDSLMTRRLVVFGSATDTTVRIGDIHCPSSDPQHLVFVGWQTQDMANDNDRYYETVDNTGAETTNPNLQNSPSDGYYISVNKNTDFHQDTPVYDLYPVFLEARWLHFYRGVSGNGSTYVGSTYKLTNDSNHGTSYDNTFFSTQSVTIRNGYEMEGWYAFAKYDNTNDRITNLNSAQPVDFSYYDASAGEVKTVTLDMKAVKLVRGEGTNSYTLVTPNVSGDIANQTVDGKNYRIYLDGTLFKLQIDGGTAKTLFGLVNGELYFYKTMHDLTLYANWQLNTTTTYKVIVWKQKITDHKDFTDAEKTYDYEIHYVSNTVSTSTQLNPASFTDSNNTTHNLTTLNFTGFHYNSNKSDMLGKTPKSNGTSVYNIYYDRNLLTINWRNGNNTANVTGYSYERTTDNDPATQYGWVNGEYIELTRVDKGLRYTYTYNPSYSESTEQEANMYGWVDDNRYELLSSTPVYENTFSYKQFDEITTNTGTQYALQNGEYVTITYGVVGTTTTFTYSSYYTLYIDTPGIMDFNTSYYGIYNGEFVQVYYNNRNWYRTRTGFITYQYSDQYSGNRYTRSNANNQSYTGTRYTLSGSTFTETDSTSGTLYGMNGTTVYVLTPNTTNVNGWLLNGSEYTGTRYIQTNTDVDYSGQRYTRSGSAGSYTYTATNAEQNGLYGLDGRGGHVGLNMANTQTGYTYTYGGEPYTGKLYIQNNEATPYTGTRYTDSACTTAAVEDGGVQYGIDSNGYKFPLNYTTTHVYEWQYNSGGKTIKYTGVRFIRTNSNTGTVTTFTGLYQQDLTQYGYEWPFKVGNNSVTWIQVDAPNQNGLIYLDAFIFDPLGGATQNKTVLNLSYQTSNNSYHVYYYLQDINGVDYPTNANVTVDMSNNSLNVTDKFTGFYCAQYKTSSSAQSWSNFGNPNTSGSYGSQSTINGLHIRLARKDYDFTFAVNYPDDATVTYDGKTVAENAVRSENLVLNNVLYEAPLNGYGSTSTTSGGVTTTHWYYGVENSSDKLINTADNVLIAPDHYIFGGWYEDATCTVPFNFNSTMPAANKIVYAKWSPESFVVKIDPNGGEIDHINHNYDNNSTDISKKGYSGYWWDNATEDENELQDSSVNAVTYTDGTKVRPFATFNRAAIQNARSADVGYISSQSTYFNANYNEPVSEYTVARNYVPISDAAIPEYKEDNPGAEIYYYVNTQKRDSDGSSLPSDLRNALYMTESELEHYYNFYRDWVVGNIKGGYITGTTVFNFNTWKQLYVSKQAYRWKNNKENYVFLGWFKVEEDGSVGQMPYVFSDPVTEDITLRAMWRLDGGYTIQYHADYYMDDGTHINYIDGTMESWDDPKVGDDTLSYADDATTTVYKQPTNITINGHNTDEYIFRGFRIVSYHEDPTTHVVTYIPLEDGVYYDPGDIFVIDPEYADSRSIIHLQAVYEEKDSSYRRPYVTNLTLDANGGYLTDGDGYVNGQWHDGVALTQDADITLDSGWNSIGKVYADVAAKSIEFGDIQSNSDVHLYRYSSVLTREGGNENTPLFAEPGRNYFEHPKGNFLIGFNSTPDYGDFLADYPADSIIAIDRNQQQTLYAVWEPLVYLNFENTTNGDIHFGLSSADQMALYVLNEVTGIYDREVMENPGDITVEAGKTLHLALPLAEGHEIVTTGVNTLGVGKALTWDTRITDDTSGITYTSVENPQGANIQHAEYYTHAYLDDNGVLHNDDRHTLNHGYVNNTETFTFTNKMLFNAKGITVTFGSFDVGYALLLHDNYDGQGNGGGTKEYDYSRDQVYVQHQSQVLPGTSTRMGYQLVGWAYDPADTTPAFSATSPSGDPWTITDLNDFFYNNNSVHKEDINNGQTRKADLYAVWSINNAANTVYVYKDVPEPGNQTMPFAFTLNVKGTYYQTSYNPTYETKEAQQVFNLAHGEYAVLNTTQLDPQGTITVNITVKNADGTDKPQAEQPSSCTIQATHPHSEGSWNDVKITVSETAVAYYDPSVKLTAKNGDFYKGTETQNPSTLMVLDHEESGITSVCWTHTDAGGTLIFKNERQTYDLTLRKVLHTNLSVSGTFRFIATYNADGVDVTRTADNIVSGAAADTVFLKDIPAGVRLTLTELNNGSYISKYSVDNGATYTAADPVYDENNVQTSVKTQPIFVDSNKDIVFDNSLKTYKVKFRLVDQYVSPQAGVFDLDSQSGIIGRDLYSGGQNSNGYFYTDDHFYIGYYILTETAIPANHIGLSRPVDITVIGTGITTDSDMVYVSQDTNDPEWWIITVYNIVPSVEVTVTKILDDPVLTQRTFDFDISYTYVMPNTDFTINHDDTYSFHATASGQSHTFSVPGGSTLTVAENLTPALSAAYDVTYSIDSGQSQTGSSWTGTVPDTNVTTMNVTFTNTRKILTVNVQKDGKDSPFDYKAKLVYNYAPVAYTSGGFDSNGEKTFTINTNNTPTALSIPYGVTLELTETDTQECEVSAEALYAEDQNDADEIFTFVVTQGDTVTFTNTEARLPAPTAVAQAAGTAFAELLMICIIGAGIYFVLSMRRKEVGCDAI